MSKKIVFWQLQKEETMKVERHCKGCKNKVDFYDSYVRRHNANGKNIYQYAIYKCANGHTWNKVLNKYHAVQVNHLNGITKTSTNSYLKKNEIKEMDKEIIEKIELTKCKEQGIYEITIIVRGTNDIRLDRLLGENIIDRSRSEIQARIKKGKVLMNGQNTKPGYRLRDGD